ncbi:phosphotransferase [Roseomonas marmotae]|uniref:Hydroxylysine kinase n=1 Tax=Roseomonas marmotae TaxID=2768161 RepID=A0ABS3KA95_9PROT|nr:phosphotransferase [Roseomonas marmotae]MBO1074374.1 phosphotransferase [Roseomonas marmotae]QTI78118.1 phosphotransferase [Roseomonas marmotae]
MQPAVVPPDHLGEILDAPPPPASTEDALELARTYFDLEAVARPLAGERDRNFHLTARDGAEYVLKVVHPAEDPSVTDFQNQALLRLACSDPGLPVPRVHPPLAVRWEVPGQPVRLVRVYSWLAGRPLHLAASGVEQRRALGAMLGRLDLALRGFGHPAQHHVLLWDIQHAARVRGLLSHIEDPARRAIPGSLLDVFERQALPVMRGLRRQVIHNDFNPHNVLADAVDDSHIAGVIDFGDMVHAPLVQDLATACAYHIQPDGHPLRGPAEIAAGFHAVCPLQPEELDILFDLIAVRGVISVAISGWRAQRQPENAPYILRNYPRAWAGLERLAAIPREEARAIFHAACGRTPAP